MSKTALITGITGQDGSYLAESLLEKGYDVTGLKRRTSVEQYDRLAHVLHHKRFKMDEFEICDSGSVYNIVDKYKPNEIYNLAAQSHVRVSFEVPENTVDGVAMGPLRILNAIKLIVPECRFYQASSSEMFGDAITERDGELFQDENTLLNPQSPYAIAKLAAHHATRLYRQSYGLHASCGILFNHESERRGGRFVTKKITKYIARLNHHFSSDGDRESAPKLHLGNLDAKRDWGHAEDYVRAMWLIVQQDAPDDYVIATGKTHSVRDFLVAAFDSIGIQDYSDFVVQDPRFMRPSEVPYLKGDPNKAKTVLGWEPEVSFEQLVSRMIDYDISALKD